MFVHDRHEFHQVAPTVEPVKLGQRYPVHPRERCDQLLCTVLCLNDLYEGAVRSEYGSPVSRSAAIQADSD